MFLYPSTLIELRKHNEKLVMVVLFNNGSGDGGANSTTAFIASGQDVDGFHGQRMVRSKNGDEGKEEVASFFGGSSQGLIVISGLDDDALVARAIDKEKAFHGLEESGGSRPS